MSDDTFTAADFESATSSGETSTAATTPEPAAPAPTASTESPTTQAADPAVTPVPDPQKTKQGPIPFDVHSTALDNARKKTREEVEAEWQAYAWAKQVDPQEFQQIQQIARHFASGDKLAGIKALLEEARQDPAIAAQLNTLSAQTLSALRRQPAHAEQEPQLEHVAIQLEDGRVVNFPTMESIAKREAWVRKQAVQEATAQFQPHIQVLQTVQQREAALQQQAEDERFVTSTLADVKKWPGMQSEENQKKLSEHMAARYRLPSNASNEQVLLALNAAYRDVILPTLQQAERRTVLDTIHQQANASTVNPAQTSVRAPKSMDEMSIAEALQHVAAQGA